jgi:hypothetical protein
MILCVVVAICFTPIKEKIRLALDRYLYREPYDYQQTVRQASQSLRATIQLTALLDHVIRIVDGTLKPEHLAVYLREEDEAAFHLAKSLAEVSRDPSNAFDSDYILSQHRAHNIP